MKAEIDPPTAGGLLGLFAHDLRNPLSAIHSNLSFLSSTLEGLDEDSVEALRDAVVSCDGLMHIIDNLELLSFFLMDRAERAVGPVNLASVIGDAVQRVQPMAASHGVGLVAAPDSSQSDAVVRANREMLARAVANLLRNCIQHTRDDVSVSLRIERDATHYRLLLCDGGPVIGEALGEKVFSPEGQISSKAQAGGRYSRGIGLMAAQLAAMAAGVQVALPDEAAQAEGVRFVLLLSPHA